MSTTSAAKPGVGGGIWLAPKGTTLPTDASTALSGSYKSLGYVSDDGVTRSLKKDTNPVNAWGGDVVAILNSKKTETFKFKLIEADNTDVLGLTFGSASGTVATGISVTSNTAQAQENVYVISTLLADNVHQRIVIPRGIVTDVGDIQYKDDAVIGYDLTITALADSDGNTAYEYQKTVNSSST